MQNALSFISNVDSQALYAVQSIGSGWRPVALFLSTGLGYPVMIIALTITLFLMRKHRIALELIVIALLSFAATFALKFFFHSPRPYLVDPNVILYGNDSGYGLPSAHALMSLVILGWVAIRHPQSHFLTWSIVAIIGLIGTSRVYLGVHYPSQVLAGWMFGVLFLYIFRLVDKRLWSPFKTSLD